MPWRRPSLRRRSYRAVSQQVMHVSGSHAWSSITTELSLRSLLTLECVVDSAMETLYVSHLTRKQKAFLQQTETGASILSWTAHVWSLHATECPITRDFQNSILTPMETQHYEPRITPKGAWNNVMGEGGPRCFTERSMAHSFITAGGKNFSVRAVETCACLS